MRYGGAAALYVCLGHAWEPMGGSSSGILGSLTRLTARLLSYGLVAVLAFFVVSGYAIHYRQANRIASGDSSPVAWRSYAVHRIRRLYPPLCVALVLTAL